MGRRTHSESGDYPTGTVVSGCWLLVVGCWLLVLGLGLGLVLDLDLDLVLVLVLVLVLFVFFFFMAMILELECSDQIMCGYVSATSMEDDELLLLVALVVGIGMVPFLAAVITGKKNACCIASFAVTRNAWS